MNLKWLGRVFGVTFVLLMLLGCGGGGSGGNDSDDGGGNPIVPPSGTVLEGIGQSGTAVSDAQRFNAFEDITATLNEIKDLSDDTFYEQLAHYLASRSEFEAAGFGPGGAWGRFTDGRIVIFDDNEVSDPSAIAGFSVQEAIERNPENRYPNDASGSSWTDIPNTTHVCFYDSAGRGWLRNVKEMIDDAQDAQGEKIYSYSVDEAENNATVDALRNIPTDCAVIGLNAHGSDMAVSRVPFLERIYAIYTSTNVTPANELIYWDMLNTTKLVYYHPIKPIKTLDMIFGDTLYHYAITKYFTDEYWAKPTRFATSKPFVYFNTCRGYNAISMPIVDSIMTAGASLFAGWTYRSFGEIGDRTASYVFDRLLGANTYPETKEDPHRPFPWNTLAAEMAALNLGVYPDDKYGTEALPNSELKFHPASSSQFKLLAPSIEYMQVDEKVDSEEPPPVLSIYGIFGDQQGEVYVIKDNDKTPLPVQSWGRDTITCHLDPEYYGDIFVKVNGNRSNLRHLSYWEGQVEFSGKPPHPNPPWPQISCDLQDLVTWDLKVRADIDTVRETPEAADADRVVQWLPEKVSTTTFSSSGSQVIQGDDGPVTYWIWSGGGMIDVNNQEDDSRSSIWFQMDTAEKYAKTDVCFLGFIETKTATVPNQLSFPQAINMTDTLLHGLFDEVDVNKGRYIIYIPFDEEWNLIGSNKSITATYGAITNVPVKVTWDRMTVSYPPWKDAEHGK